jgi:hypothetical protein
MLLILPPLNFRVLQRIGAKSTAGKSGEVLFEETVKDEAVYEKDACKKGLFTGVLNV